MGVGTKKPWQRLHADIVGPLFGSYFLLLMDANLKWPEIIAILTTTVNRTISEMRKIFSTYGCPEQLVLDNGPQFCTTKFATLLKRNMVKHGNC